MHPSILKIADLEAIFPIYGKTAKYEYNQYAQCCELADLLFLKKMNETLGIYCKHISIVWHNIFSDGNQQTKNKQCAGFTH